MKDNTLFVDSSTRGQIGWRDSDSDGKPDPVDTTPTISLAQYAPDPTRNTTLSYSGYVQDVPYPHAACAYPCVGKDVTIQTIEDVSYRVDDGAWNPAVPADGNFDTDTEDFSFTTTILDPATHTIDVQSSNLIGNVSSAWSDSVTISPPAQSVGPGKYDDTHIDWTYSGNWTALTASGPYNDTLHYSTTINDEAILDFVGTQFILTYTGNSNRGNVDVYVDDEKVGTINQYSASLTWQKKLEQPNFH
jgi:hypothetical protein